MLALVGQRLLGRGATEDVAELEEPEVAGAVRLVVRERLQEARQQAEEIVERARQAAIAYELEARTERDTGRIC